MKNSFFRSSLIILSAFSFIGCSLPEDPFNPNYSSDSDWIIDEDYIREGCFAGRDCIPSIDKPDFSMINETSSEFLKDDDLVVGIWDGTNYLAFAHSILDWHEIVNGNNYTISYCPLTGSALHISTSEEFGVSGLLYNSNLIMYDRNSSSYWPQMLLKSAAGNRQNENIQLKPLIETSWKNWKALFPNTLVLNKNTGYHRDYNDYPYGNYKNCNSNACGDYIYFPVSNQDEKLPAKARVLTLITDSTVIDGEHFNVILSGADNIAIAFNTERTLEIDLWTPDNGIIRLKDQNSSSVWNILGQSVQESETSDPLNIANSYIAYWFSVAAFFSEVEIF
jgi:hypothetical protein